jgi:hypothetical protein
MENGGSILFLREEKRVRYMKRMQQPACVEAERVFPLALGSRSWLYVSITISRISAVMFRVTGLNADPSLRPATVSA